MPFKDILAIAVVITIWGANFSVAKFGLAAFPPLMMVALRFALLLLLLAPFLFKRTGIPVRGFILVGICLGGFHFGLLMTGLSGTDAGAAAVVIQLAMPFSAMLAWGMLGDRMRPIQIVGMMVAFAGVFILAGSPRFLDQWGALLLVAGAAFAWALANILIQRLAKVNVFVLNAWVALFALPVQAVASLTLETGHLELLASAGWTGWGSILYQALGSMLIAYGLWYRLLDKHPVNKLVPPMLLVPVFGVLLAEPLLDEPLTAAKIIGGLITILGVAMIELTRGKKAEVA
ncbi:DMT family transporter [Magnetospira sp. QH-2]|uniref:DMT family transporter n=1 Tax=Magnetospira sp. (strain QH-2) TaxID=1288970 RepID=UPI0003E80A2B|nr:EamA family transporter [Magnetospira sp. QH-2]CCQ72825.1 putative permease of the drug/metabolite transporter superfamily [Magnetospira sp. QH-2]